MRWSWSATIFARTRITLLRSRSRAIRKPRRMRSTVNWLHHYRPGQPRRGLLVQLVERVGHLQSVAARSRHDLPFAPLSAVPERVTFPIDIWRLANPRWQKLGYRSLSAYITALIRYDLLVGGPHASTTADCRSKLQRKLTRKTLADRRKGRRRKILLDHLIEKREGRPVRRKNSKESKRISRENFDEFRSHDNA